MRLCFGKDRYDEQADDAETSRHPYAITDFNVFQHRKSATDTAEMEFRLFDKTR